MTVVPQGFQARTVRVLAFGQALGGLGGGATLAIGSVLAAELAGDAWAGAAATLSTLGAAAASIPLARLALARGRRWALASGALVAMLGCVLTVVAVGAGLFPLLLLSYAMLGVGSAAGLQARFAATDAAEPARRGRDLSVVVWSTTVGVVVGPNLFGPGVVIGEWLGLPEHTGSFVIAVAAQVAASIVYLVGLRPDPLSMARPVERAPVDEPGMIRGRGVLVFAIGSLALSHAVMVSIMSMTPVHLTTMGASLTVVGFTISLHVAGMFAFSPLFGWASDRMGRVPTILMGQLLFVTAILVLAFGERSNVAVGAGLVLLGLGWSAATVAASALVSDVVTGTTRVTIQGRSDTVMNIAGAAGGALAGPVLALVGYAGLAWIAGVLVLVVILAASVIGQRVQALRP